MGSTAGARRGLVCGGLGWGSSGDGPAHNGNARSVTYTTGKKKIITQTHKEVGEGWVEGMDTLLEDGQADVSGTLLQQLFGGDVTLGELMLHGVDSALTSVALSLVPPQSSLRHQLAGNPHIIGFLLQQRNQLIDVEARGSAIKVKTIAFQRVKSK